MKQTAQFKGKECFEQYCKRYEYLLKMYYPAHKSTGFTERNQTVNFAAAIEAIYESAFTWYEAPIGNTKKEHLDAVIFVPEISSTIMVEAKRISNVNKKLREVAADIDRICDKQSLRSVCQGLRANCEHCAENTYGIILADIWPNDTKEKAAIYEAWRSKAFMDYLRQKHPAVDNSMKAAADAVWLDYEYTFPSDLSRYCLLALMCKL